MAGRAWQARLVPSAVALALAASLPSAHSRPMARATFALIALSVAAAVWALASPGPGEERAPLRRRQLALALASTAASLGLALGLAARLSPGPTEAYRRSMLPDGSTMQPSTSDPELAWGPQAPAGVVGQRLEQADFGRDRVLVMGDSILYGLNVTHDQTAPRRLEPLLGGPQVLNASVSGYSVDQYYLYLRRILPVIKPKLVVVGVFSGNDWQLTGRSFVWGHKKPLLVERGGDLIAADDGAECADDLSRSLLFRAMWRRPKLAESLIASLCSPRELPPGEHERLMYRLFDEIDALCAREGAKVLWLLLPPRNEHNAFDETRFFYVEKHRELRRALLSRPRALFDLAPPLQQELDRAEELFQKDQAHFTPDGHELLAQLLARELKQRYPELAR